MDELVVLLFLGYLFYFVRYFWEWIYLYWVIYRFIKAALEWILLLFFFFYGFFGGGSTGGINLVKQFYQFFVFQRLGFGIVSWVVGVERRRFIGLLGYVGCRRVCGLQAVQEMRVYYVLGIVLYLGNLRINQLCCKFLEFIGENRGCA